MAALDCQPFDSSVGLILAEVTLNPRNPKMTIGVGREAVPYVFYNMHFHWGGKNAKGSEHSVDNHFGSSEVFLLCVFGLI